MSKPLLCLDFDGVLHAYTSGWQGANIIPDGPVPGAMEFLRQAVKRFRVAIYSSRSGQENGIPAMRFRIASWMKQHLLGLPHTNPAESIIAEASVREEWTSIIDAIEWPTEKPPALVTIDDRAITFTGVFPTLDEIADFTPWNKKSKGPFALISFSDRRVAANTNTLASVFVRELGVSREKAEPYARFLSRTIDDQFAATIARANDAEMTLAKIKSLVPPVREQDGKQFRYVDPTPATTLEAIRKALYGL